MSVTGVNNSFMATNYAPAANSQTPPALYGQTDPMDEAAIFEKSAEVSAPKTYTRDKTMIGELRAKDRAYIDSLRTLVSQLVEQCKSCNVAGKKFNGSLHGCINPSKIDSYWDLLIDNGDGTFSFHPDLSADAQNALIAKAKEDIGEDGYYGVKQTSQRILDFAKAVTGGDPSKIGLMREYIQKGFDEVRSMFGGQLPDICNQTYDVIMKGLDEWEAKGAI